MCTSRCAYCRYEACRARLHEPALALRLYYAAPLAQLSALLDGGFDAAPPDRPDLDAFGRGWYFSRCRMEMNRESSGPHCACIHRVFALLPRRIRITQAACSSR